MCYRSKVTFMATMAALCLSVAAAQDRDRDRGRYYGDRAEFTRVEPGTIVPVRLNQTIDVERRDNRIYYGIVDQDVRGDNGRLAIPRGSNIELMVRIAPDNDLILDLESVTVNGERYAIRTAVNRVESRPDMVGSIVGAIN